MLGGADNPNGELLSYIIGADTGHGATEAARPERSLQARGFASGMEARQGGDSSAGSVHDSPPRQGDARKRHKQENNKTDNNQGSSNQSQNRRKKRIIKGKVM